MGQGQKMLWLEHLAATREMQLLVLLLFFCVRQVLKPPVLMSHGTSLFFFFFNKLSRRWAVWDMDGAVNVLLSLLWWQSAASASFHTMLSPPLSWSLSASVLSSKCHKHIKRGQFLNLWTGSGWIFLLRALCLKNKLGRKSCHFVFKVQHTGLCSCYSLPVLGFVEAVSRLLDGVMPGGTASLVVSLLRVLQDKHVSKWHKAWN